MLAGAGAGGSFAAYELRKLADEAGIPLNVTVFERASYIGGRSTTVNVFDHPAYPIELGASIFVQVNHNLVNASRDLGLTVSAADHARPREADESIGIWDGTQFVFTMKDSYSWWNLARLFWRYGMAPLRTQNLMKYRRQVLASVRGTALPVPVTLRGSSSSRPAQCDLNHW